jgi:hypothetical protein
MRRLHLDEAEKSDPAILRIPDADDERRRSEQDCIGGNHAMRGRVPGSRPAIRGDQRAQRCVKQDVDQEMLEKPKVAKVEGRPELALGPEVRLRHVAEEIPVQGPLRQEILCHIGPIADRRRGRIESEMGPAHEGYDCERAEQQR